MKTTNLFFTLILASCTTTWVAPPQFVPQRIKTDDFTLQTYQKNTDSASPVHIYIEGDGHAFDAYGNPTNNPTPHNTLVRDLAAGNSAPNVAYIARPCQYIMSPNCNIEDWTVGRFSESAVNAVRDAIKQIAKNRPVVLIGYSGGAMISGLVIKENPDIDIQKWITIAGVLNHKDWTEHFNDTPLYKSKNLNTLPQIPQTHYVAEYDKVVPIQLSKKWIADKNMIVIKDATHNNFNALRTHLYY